MTLTADHAAAASTPTPIAQPDLEPRKHARTLYWQGWRIARIAELLQIKPATIHSWKKRDAWDQASPIERVDAAIEARMILLVNKTDKEGRDFKELDLLGRQLERTARVKRYQAGGTEADLNPNIERRNAGPKRKPVKNQISEEGIDRMREAFQDEMFAYQEAWYLAGKKHRIRNILKSRQIGATYYFAHEALMDAIDTGRNQIFLSASKAQAHQFRSYITQFAQRVADVELRGDPIVLPNGAELIFLGTNSRTAQSYHGNLYLDEYFWIPRYQELRKVASGMASQKRWRQTYFSTPSAKSHEAYPFWTGALYNRGRAKSDHINIDVSHAALKHGRLCEDGQYKQIITLLDAEAGGCDLFDIDQLRREYSPEEFSQLFMCNFIDDGASVFPFALVQACMVDSWAEWDDFKPLATRPFGSRRVWIGYDPSRSGDSAAMVVVAPPAVRGAPFRILERHQFSGMDFASQADRIRLACNSYNVEHITIDTSGLGIGVFDLVRSFRPDCRGFNYSVEAKTRMVLKAHDVLSHRRLQFDAGWSEVAASFLAIKKIMTPSGQQVTYAAGRSEETSHADLAWATMQALINEPFEGSTPTNTSIVEFST